MKFLPSKFLTVGVELEVQIVDPETGSLVRKAEEIFKNLNSPFVHKEFLRSTVEYVSPVSFHPLEAVEKIEILIKKSLEIGKEKGFTLSASGTHPFAKPEEVRVVEDLRYKKLYEEFQEILREFLIYGLHVHVGFPDEETALNGFNFFVKYSPLLLSLSASSPFFKGRNTGILSYRSKVFERLPRAGIPQQFHSYDQFLELFYFLKSSGAVESLKDLWWDVRLRPDLGTVEVRICDALSDFERLKAVAVLIALMGELSLKERVEPTYHQINLQNRWNGARYGLKGDFLEKGTVIKIGKVLENLLAEYEKSFTTFEKEIPLVRKFLGRPTVAEEQLRVFSETKSFREVISYLRFKV